MFRPLRAVTHLPPVSRRLCLAAMLLGFAGLGAACTGAGMGDFGSIAQPSGPPQQPTVRPGEGRYFVQSLAAVRVEAKPS